MEWFVNLFMGSGVAHSLFLIALIIAIGTQLGKIKIAGVSLGITWILFVGIFASALGMRVDAGTLHFIKEFGLILFIYSIGLQVGPGFFASFKKGGITLNMLAVGFVLLGCITTYVIHLFTDTSLITMIGVLSGAVTNTPGLGAAQQTLLETTGAEDPSIAMGYAVAYPLGVVGVIISLLLIKKILKVDVEKEKAVADAAAQPKEVATRFAVMVENPGVFGKPLFDVDKLIGRPFVVSRIYHSDGTMEVASSSSVINKDDRLLIVTSSPNIENVATFLGRQIEVGKDMVGNVDTQLVSRKILVTKPEVNGRTLGELKLRSIYGINITRVNRSGIDLTATPDLILQMGDRVMVVGSEKAINKVSVFMGNSSEQLWEPNLIPLFFGIALGVLLGSIPFMFPGMPQAVKLGLAGGPLIIAILMSRFGPKYHLITYTTISANKMLREIGISLFLAAVGLGAGEGFVDMILSGGYLWILYGFIITIVPVIIISIIARKACKLNYFQILGLISGSSTNPPALAFSNSIGGATPSVTYATVYPITMFLRVLTAQILILMAI
ncbi:MAG: putative transporter [Bacteroidales bacterium]|nr:putative transporter [Bacteroidales bacterium]MDD4670958.1 putative transporter [Bacteroidales bacterium]